MKDTSIFLEMKNISKTYPGVRALENVDFDLKKGEVHALVGENGAGKSTLMKILSGFHRKDSGDIRLEGKAIDIKSPRAAISLGISTIYQDIIAVPYISVAENILMGNRPRNRFGIIRWRELNRKVSKLLEELSIDLNTRETVSNLSTAQQQLVEIVKALSIDSKIIIMDEPTAPLTEDEKNILFMIINNIKKTGVSVIYISHRMEEIFEIADRVTILRDGKKINTKPVKDTSHDEVIKDMIGREIDEMFSEKKSTDIDKVILEIKDFSKAKYFKNIDFELHKGEILGFAGLVGAGRSELMKTIFGILNKDSGEVYLDGNKVTIRSPKKAIRLGLGLVPEDRKTEGLILDLPVDQNISIADLKNISRFGVIISRMETRMAKGFVKSLAIKCYRLSQKVMNLSGGNQQKVIIARWLALNPKVLILDEPTKGIDVGSKAEIHKLIIDIAKHGTSVILISSEMTEILKMSNRIIIMKEGRIVNEINGKNANEEVILRNMTGIHNNPSSNNK